MANGNIYKLCNQVKHYEWGSPDFIPRLMGTTPDGSPSANGVPSTDGEPFAELWMGSHSGAPSRVSLPDDAPSTDGKMSLGELIAVDPCRYLGEETRKRYGDLPFLFKLLAVEKPLSLQAQPNLAQAREGFERENREGLAPNAPNRNYRDPNHKPEMLCALTPFTGMCGFRPPDEIKQLFAVFSAAPPLVREGFAPLIRALEISDPASALREFFNGLFGLSFELRKMLTEFILSSDDAVQNTGVQTSVSPLPDWELIRQFARLYPGDPAIIVPLYLNVFRLEPGEAVFLKAGLLHAYIHGFALELMANSDNVLRGGLTSKHIDSPELMKVLDFNPYNPQIIKPDSGLSCFTYPAPCEEFSLSMIRGTKHGGTAVLDRSYPSISIVTEGEVSVGGTMIKRGESAFIPPVATPGGGEEPLVLQGNFTLYAATSHATFRRAGPQ
jgi:mannose-6-phosphate isomerase